MSRFGDDGGDWDYGRYSLWEQAMARSLSGRRGQAALADLEAALLALPEHRLIHGALARDGEVCAIGALVLAKRTAAGESRDQVLAALAKNEDSEYDPDITARLGARHGNMAYAMAWRIAELNDEDIHPDSSPEHRFQQVLAWVRRAQLRGTPTAAKPQSPDSASGSASSGVCS